MKLVILLLSILSVFPGAASERKLSSSRYYKCFLDREPTKNHPEFSKEFIFPYPTSAEENHEIRGSMRWNSFSINFHLNGLVEATITEEIKGQRISVTKTHQLGGNPSEEEFKVTLKVNGNVTYTLRCGPE